MGFLLRGLVCSLVLTALSAGAEDFSSVLKLGGDTSVLLETPSAFAFRNPAQNLSAAELARHIDGDALFEQKFGSDTTFPFRGLGPVFNNNACTGCHVQDGRGMYPVLSEENEWTPLSQNSAVFLRISREDEGASPKTPAETWGGPHGVPGFGNQLYQSGLFGLRDDLPGIGQARVLFRFVKSQFTYPDGTSVELQRPEFKVEDPWDGSSSELLKEGVHFSPRMTPPMVGLGLLEAVREEDILALAKRDLSELGIHGHPNYVFDLQKHLDGNPHPVSLGRFGLKANTPTIFHQTMGALNGDMGVTTVAMPNESILGTELFERFKDRWTPGIDMPIELSDLLVFYSETLAVPSRRDILDETVKRGGEIFMRVGCASCHQPTFVTGDSANPALANQTIYPFTDMLLHDMGEGLADHRQDFQANGREWRTRALWGIGLTQVVNRRAGFLHDGRARTLEEAILWHGGESQKVVDKFTGLALSDRQALIRFLRSL